MQYILHTSSTASHRTKPDQVAATGAREARLPALVVRRMREPLLVGHGVHLTGVSVFPSPAAVNSRWKDLKPEMKCACMGFSVNPSRTASVPAPVHASGRLGDGIRQAGYNAPPGMEEVGTACPALRPPRAPPPAPVPTVSTS